MQHHEEHMSKGINKKKRELNRNQSLTHPQIYTEIKHPNLKEHSKQIKVNTIIESYLNQYG